MCRIHHAALRAQPFERQRRIAIDHTLCRRVCRRTFLHDNGRSCASCAYSPSRLLVQRIESDKAPPGRQDGIVGPDCRPSAQSNALNQVGVHLGTGTVYWHCLRRTAELRRKQLWRSAGLGFVDQDGPGPAHAPGSTESGTS